MPTPLPLAVPAEEVSPPSQEQAVKSKSGQFQIYGEDKNISASISFLTEETKSRFLTLLDEKDSWKVPVIIRLHGKQGDPLPAVTQVIALTHGEDGFKLRMDLHISHGLDQTEFHRNVITALLYERALKNDEKQDDDTPLIIRPWLAEGILEALDWKENKTDRRLYATLFQTGGLFDLNELVNTTAEDYERDDAVIRTAFRVSSGALMMALIEQPEGKKALNSFLSEAAYFGGDMPMLLRKHFPNLNLSQKSLEKWWALQMANLSRTPLSEILSIAETETALTQALTLQIHNPNSPAFEKPLTAWTEIATLDPVARKATVQRAQESLMRLSYRCFPSYRPILIEYQKLLSDIAANKANTIQPQIAALDERRLLMSQRANRSRDYLDWFEITRARETSGVFDDYIKLKMRLNQGLLKPDDHISRTLDKAQEIFNR